jgi:hypothetical protein
LYQVPICHSTAMATSAASPNQAMAPCPCGMTTAAASSGPTALPVLPPTWKIDCASPGCPPEARRAMREDSGWNTDEPVPPGGRHQHGGEVGRHRQQQQAAQRGAHAEGQRMRLGVPVGVQAHQRLQQRGRELVGQRDQPDLREAQAELALEHG